MRRLSPLSLGLAALALGCGWDGGDLAGGSGGSSQQQETKVTVVSGDFQEGEPGKFLPLPLSVEVSVCSGSGSCSPVTHGTVSWPVGVGGGRPASPTTAIDTAGHASVRFQLGSGLGEYSPIVYAIYNGGGIGFTATGVAAQRPSSTAH